MKLLTNRTGRIEAFFNPEDDSIDGAFDGLDTVDSETVDHFTVVDVEGFALDVFDTFEDALAYYKEYRSAAIYAG